MVECVPQQPAPLPPDIGDTFAVAQARAAGVRPGRLRAQDLRAPFRGVRTTVGSPRSPVDGTPLAVDRATRVRVLNLARAYATVMRPHAFFAGRTAAVIHGAPLAHGPDLVVGVAAPARAPRRRGIRGVKVSPSLVRVGAVDGLPVSSPATTWAMLGAELSERELIFVGDHLVRFPRDSTGLPRPERRLADLADLEAAAAAGIRQGAAKLRGALARIRVGSSSPLETDYRLDAEAAGLPTPELDVEIRDGRGLLLGISEFVYRAYRTVVEVEGDHHRTSRAQWNRDLEKYAAYAAAGWEIVRLSSHQIRGSRTAAPIVGAVLARRGWTPGRP